MNRAARTIRDNARILYSQALRVAQNQAALRIFDSVCCSALAYPFCASDVRLVNDQADAIEAGFDTVYDCLCPACVEAHPS